MNHRILIKSQINLSAGIAGLLLAAALVTASACSGTANSNKSNVSVNAANSNGSTANTAGTPSESKPTAEATGSLATPTEAYRTAYDCRKRKDIDCLKKVMSQDILDFLKMMGEADKKSLDETLKELCESPQATTNESRNEKITGDRATLEYLDASGSWRSMDFEKVGSDWKMAAPAGGPEAAGKKKP